MNKRKKETKRYLLVITSLFLFCFQNAHAFSVGITVKGQVLAPPCTINNGSEIFVHFGGGILPESIDGKNHERVIPYTLDCTGSASNLLKIKITGTGSPFNNTLLGTSKNNLAIEVKNNSYKFPLNSWANITYPTQPVLSAVLVRNGTGAISVGLFGATATIVVEYR
ncbi:fimbrial protein [Pantoea rwandensis]|uniref:fimbrial protein n=1 Tax=Pantoea rwandensis TaxID=1076550 RepID=UPI000A11934D|nr:fimbrial protein [Pantoea rwandensis]